MSCEYELSLDCYMFPSIDFTLCMCRKDNRICIQQKRGKKLIVEKKIYKYKMMVSCISAPFVHFKATVMISWLELNPITTFLMFQRINPEIIFRLKLYNFEMENEKFFEGKEIWNKILLFILYFCVDLLLWNDFGMTSNLTVSLRHQFKLMVIAMTDHFIQLLWWLIYVMETFIFVFICIGNLFLLLNVFCGKR